MRLFRKPSNSSETTTYIYIYIYIYVIYIYIYIIVYAHTHIYIYIYIHVLNIFDLKTILYRAFAQGLHHFNKFTKTTCVLQNCSPENRTLTTQPLTTESNNGRGEGRSDKMSNANRIQLGSGPPSPGPKDNAESQRNPPHTRRNSHQHCGNIGSPKRI